MLFNAIHGKSMQQHKLVRINSHLTVWVKLFPGSGPHAGAWKFYYNGKWHHWRWASKKEIYRMEKSNNDKQKELHKSF